MVDRTPVSEQWRCVWHRPRVYRYEVSAVVRRRLPRPGFNRYPGCKIGWSLVVGRFAYCVKWGSPGPTPANGAMEER